MNRRALTQTLGLFVGGAAVGAVLAGTVGASAQSGGSPAPTGYAAAAGAPGPGFGFDHHRRPGLPQTGKVTTVGSDSVTIQTSSGTKTYAVDDKSDIDKNGEATLEDLVAGDAVRFAVRPGTSTIAVLHTGDEAKNTPAGRPGLDPRRGPDRRHGPCPGGHGPDGGQGHDGGTPTPAPSATASSNT